MAQLRGGIQRLAEEGFRVAVGPTRVGLGGRDDADADAPVVNRKDPRPSQAMGADERAAVLAASAPLRHEVDVLVVRPVGDVAQARVQLPVAAAPEQSGLARRVDDEARREGLAIGELDAADPAVGVADQVADLDVVAHVNAQRRGVA